MINSRQISDLTPETQILCDKFIKECAKQDIDILITSTYRDSESQNALYAQGRTAIGHKVTNARAGFSFHNYRIAFDFVPLKNGKAQWEDIDLFKHCGKIAESLGLEWAGSWKSFREFCHCQLPGLSLTELRSGKHLA